jgi:hypothetical protein
MRDLNIPLWAYPAAVAVGAVLSYFYPLGFAG